MVGPGSNIKIIPDDPPRDPSPEEVDEYAEFLGIDPKGEPHLMWIAREGVVAPVPPPWKACTENQDDIFYFNFETGESVWDHPCDEKYRRLVEQHRELAQRKATGGDAKEQTRQDEALSSSLEGRADRKPAGQGDKGAGRLALISQEISDDESDADGMAVDVLDLEVASRNNGGLEAVRTLLRLAQRHRDAGAAAEQKETLERALAICDQTAKGEHELEREILQGLVQAYALVGEPEARRRTLERMDALSRTASGASAGVSPQRGLAGVGLAPANLSSVEEADNPDEDVLPKSNNRKPGDKLQRPTPLQLDSQLELSGQSNHSGKNSSAFSDISDSFGFDLSLSPSASVPGLGGRATPLGDTMELSVSASVSLDASGENSTLDTAARAAVRQSMTEFRAAAAASSRPPARRSIEGEVKSLNRALAMLKEIREKQREYLGLLEEAL